jgi:hypothetical protein
VRLPWGGDVEGGGQRYAVHEHVGADPTGWGAAEVYFDPVGRVRGDEGRSRSDSAASALGLCADECAVGG